MLIPDLHSFQVVSHANTLQKGSEDNARSMLKDRRPLRWRDSGAVWSGNAGTRRAAA